MSQPACWRELAALPIFRTISRMQFLVVELLAGVCLCCTGLSHWFHAESWCKHFADLAEKGTPGVFANALMHAGVGALFIATHPVFVGWNAILTYWACLVLAKGLFYLIAPAIGLRAMRACDPKKATRMRYAAIPMLALGVTIMAIAIASR